MAKSSERVEKQVALDARTTHTTTDVLYDSQPNPTILCLSSTKKCAKRAVERTVQAGAGNDVPEGQWDVLGDELAKRWTWAFK
eukprot:3333438-Karenia_brevis.AAC.1